MRTTRIGAKWTPTEDVLIRELFPEHPASYIAELIERTVAAIHARAHKLGVRKNKAAGDEGVATIAKQKLQRREFCLIQSCPYATRIAENKWRCLQPACMREGGGLCGSAT